MDYKRIALSQYILAIKSWKNGSYERIINNSKVA